VEGDPTVLIRRVYTALWWAALPLLPVRLWWRGRREPGYRTHVAERFGRYAPRPHGEIVWLHAVSLGETRAAAPLVARLLQERPTANVLLTHMTATGRAAGAALADPRVVQSWLPYDVPFAVERFLAHFRPCAGLLMETEVWPNLLAAARRHDVPVFLVNARLSERSARRYGRIPAFARAAFASLAGAATQTEDDAARLRALGTADVACTGNLKFDQPVATDVRARAASLRAALGERPVLVAASTRDGEEAVLLDAFARDTARAAPALPPRTLVVIVPRHPQRFDEVAALLRARGLRFARRTEATWPTGIDVLLGDSMGELPVYYAAADVAFVGGSLVPLGGQNLLEPIALGVPTLIGPHTFNFIEAADAAIAAGAARRVADADALVGMAGTLLQDPAARADMRARSTAFMAAHRGAVDRLWAWLAPRLPTISRANAG
jgi:3-deoxy-D-manno-octulosonic-acid transferase